MTLITFITRIHFADRVLEDALAEELNRQEVRRPLLVLDESESSDEAAERVLDALPLSSEPTTLRHDGSATARDRLRAASALLAEAGCDGIVACGGARTLDLARLAGDARLRVIAIPTGTESVGLGSPTAEFARCATRCASVPSAILCDATLTTGADPASTAAAGMGALIRCLEAYLGSAYNPPADGIALDGLRRATLRLEAAVDDGGDLQARREMLAVSLDAGLAEQKGFGGIEAAARGLETRAPARRGALHAALLPSVLEFNAPAIGDRLGEIRTALGLRGGGEVGDALVRLAERLGLPLRLSEAGVAPRHLAAAAREAAADAANRSNPRHATRHDYLRMMRAAL